MIQLSQFVVPGREFWAAQCPECYGVIKFHLAMAHFCPHCLEILPPSYRLVDEDPDFATDYRIKYHWTGEVY